MSGYTDCACRDCFEIAIGEPSEALCDACEEAGCEADGESECDAPHAYCAADSRSAEPDVEVDGVTCCPVCGLPWEPDDG